MELKRSAEYPQPPRFSNTQMQQPAVITVSQPQPVGWRLEEEEPPPSNYLALSVFNGLCCCSIFGIIAIILSILSRNAAKTGKSANILSVIFERLI